MDHYDAREIAVATMAAAIITSMGREVSLREAMQIRTDVWRSMYPQEGHAPFHLSGNAPPEDDEDDEDYIPK